MKVLQWFDKEQARIVLILVVVTTGFLVAQVASVVFEYIEAKLAELEEVQFTVPPAQKLRSQESLRLMVGDMVGAPEERAYMQTLRSEDKRMK